MVIWLVPLLAFIFCALAEWLQLRRTRRVSYLAFGPKARPRGWVAAVPLMRAAAMTAICWGLVVLWQIDGADAITDNADAEIKHHVVIALDVSPSMQLPDSGPTGKQTRAERAREVLRSILDRLQIGETRVSVIAFYSEARPVVVDTFDSEVVANILNDLPLEHAFSVGQTDMYSAVGKAAEIAKTWPVGTATLLLVSDGDTLPAKQPQSLTRAFGHKLMIGVGNPHRGQTIDGHSSRQDAKSLKQLALRLGGEYKDANTKHIDTFTLQTIAAGLPVESRSDYGMQDAAIAALLIGAALLALIAPALALAGSAWSPRRARRMETLDLDVELLTTTMN